MGGRTPSRTKVYHVLFRSMCVYVVVNRPYSEIAIGSRQFALLFPVSLTLFLLSTIRSMFAVQSQFRSLRLANGLEFGAKANR